MGKKHFPTREEIVRFVNESPTPVGKREIARAFNIKGDARVALKELLRDMKRDGQLEGGRREHTKPGELPKVTVLDITHEAPDGSLIARPAKWTRKDPAPLVLVHDKAERGTTPPGVGDRVLARLAKTNDDPPYEAWVMKRLSERANAVLGIYHRSGDDHRIVLVDRKARFDLAVAPADLNGAEQGELVEAEILPERKFGLKRGRVLTRLGKADTPARASLIAIAEQGIPNRFPEDVVAEAKAAQPVEPSPAREDLTHLPLITIDPSDARDHDDAICAAPDEDPANPGGFVVYVAIADVAHYVTPGSALDMEARKRGNSTYFPDRVVPMLPEELSADLCSLHEGAVRPVMAVRMVFNADGEKTGHRFMRGLMRSPASLSYEDAQAAFEGTPTEKSAPFVEDVLAPLYATYQALARARDAREPLDLDLPEHKINIGPDGHVTSVTLRERKDAHRLVEDFMIQANVAAAETLEQHLGRKGLPVLYRCHDAPSDEKVEALREYLKELDVPFAKGQHLQPHHFNRLLRATAALPEAVAMQEIVLRTQAQAVYGTDPIGHFGLNLARYSHFTSPIRRYSDLLVHRSLIRALGLGNDGLTDAEIAAMDEIAEHISQTERRSMAAERATNDRLIAHYLRDRGGSEFEGRITGVANAGLFIRLDGLGADGFVPARSLGQDWYDYNEKAHAMEGRSTGEVIAMGDRVTVRLIEAAPFRGGLLMEMVDHTPLRPNVPRGARGKQGGHKKHSKNKDMHGKPKGGKKAGKHRS